MIETTSMIQGSRDNIKKPPSSQQKNYKSCRGCRQAKHRCEGLEESYLRALDDPNFVPNISPLPRCLRCTQRDVDCTFDPVRRKGRPPKRGRSPSPNPPRLPSISLHRPHISDPTPDRYTPPRESESPPPPPPRREAPKARAHRLPPAFSHGKYIRLRPSAPSAPSTSRRLPPIQSLLNSQSSRIRIPSAPSSRLVPPRFNLETVCKAYLSDIFTWNPLLPAEFDKLGYHLSTCDPLLLTAIKSTVDPSLETPPFPPPNSPISLSLLQAATLFVTRAFGNGETSQAIEITRWALSSLYRLGWRGNDTSQLSPSICRSEWSAFIYCGWSVHSLSIWIGVLTGERNLFFVEVELKDEIVPENMMNHALALLRDATDFEHVETLTKKEKGEYEQWILQRNDQIVRAAVDFLDSTTPAFDPIPHLRPESLIIAATRETAFITAIISSSSPILLLSRTPSSSRFLSSDIPEDLSNLPTLSASTRSSIAQCSAQILNIARTRNRQGKLIALQPHCSSYGFFILAAAFGVLLGADVPLGSNSVSNFVQEGEAGGGGQSLSSFDLLQVEVDFKFCQDVLEHANQRKWRQTDELRTKMEKMKETSPIFRKRASSTLASLLN
ncbi:hypothetical protein JCM3765_006930 [Sporobolomyces pararoseus]